MQQLGDATAVEDVIASYARYLEGKTVTPERGDYYLTPDDGMTQAPGRWLANDDTLTSLGIQPGGPLQGADFIALNGGTPPRHRTMAAPRGRRRRQRRRDRRDVQRPQVRINGLGAG